MQDRQIERPAEPILGACAGDPQRRRLGERAANDVFQLVNAGRSIFLGRHPNVPQASPAIMPRGGRRYHETVAGRQSRTGSGGCANR
jgi:hypothetical protein